MFSRLLKRIHTELGHFYALDKNVRRILLSYALYLAAFPMVMTFMQAYLWRTSGSLWTIVIYYLGYIAGLPLGFYLNGMLLKKIHVLRLYLIGAIIQGATACLVVFFPFHDSLNILLYGCLYGLGSGLFWGNKNYLSLFLTKHTNRVYYNSMEQIIDLFINIVVPATVGWFIIFTAGTTFPLDLTSYKIIMTVAFFLLILSGFVVQSADIKTISIKGLIVHKPSASWRHMRLFHILYNTQIGLSLVTSSVMVLVLVGGEGILGTLHALTAGISVIILYVIGRKTTISSSWKLVAFGSLVFLIGAGVLAGFFTWIGALAYTIAITVSWAFQWSASYAVTMELMDSEEDNAEKQYAYVCDNELFFNIGRLLGIVLVVLITSQATQNTALQWAPLIIGVIQIPLAYLIFILAKDVRRRKNILVPTPETRMA